MRELLDGQTAEVQGSARKPYLLKNQGGVYSCTCPAWLHQNAGVERRTCKHLKQYLGEAVELARVGTEAAVARPKRTPAKAEGSTATAAPPLLLAHSWQNDVDLAGWWMSEKLDGVRAWWDGKTFWSRLGNEFYAPSFFTEGLPNTFLDGELWVARKKFQRSVSIVRRQDRSQDWAELTFVVFDAPKHPGPFEERIQEVARLVGKNKHAVPHPHEPVRDAEHLQAELKRVEALGGEGLMLRKPGSGYEIGRSWTLLKVKSFKDDEAEVVGHLAGAGRHKGRLGAVEAKLRDGTLFSVGTGFSDKEREDPPPIGSIITVRYQELSDDGVPRFPSYVGVRIDAEFKRVAPKVKAVSAPVPNGLQRFEMAQKFWAVAIDGSSLRINFGKIGSRGQQQLKTVGSEDEAAQLAARLISEKTKKGYQLVS
jgi:DNA ligase-1